eukprot:m.164022 g.164022  ORF g.164022 m.164022 type:complete len:263 (-) comp31317_c0_seq1:141-929(-)
MFSKFLRELNLPRAVMLLGATTLASWILIQYTVLAQPKELVSERTATDTRTYDAVVVLGGGLDAEGKPHPWVKARLDLAASMDTRVFVVLSRGTTHKPPPLDEDGFPIDEATASAKYLVEEHHISPQWIMSDTWSLDTIGNAFFAAAMICEPLQLRRLLIVSSHSHIERTKTIFNWVLPLWSDDFELHYASSEDVGMDEEMLQARQLKENRAVSELRLRASQLNSKFLVTEFMLKRHGAYVATGRARAHALTPEEKALRKTY